MTITVSTDGSALGNPNGPMGWAWADHAVNAARTDGHQHDGDSDAGGATNGTNQIGELCAVLEALRAHRGAEPLTIETDSQYAINCSTTWVKGWKKNGWKNSQKKPVKNAPLIKAIDAEIGHREGPVKFVWVKGHNGNPGNEKVDDLAHTYSGDARSGVKDGYLPLEGWQSLLASPYAKGVDIPADAKMLIDGKITEEQYHLGRGADAQDDSDNDDWDDSGTSQNAHEPTLAERLAEPEGVPEYDFSPRKPIVAHHRAAENDEPASHDDSANRPNTDSQESGRTVRSHPNFDADEVKDDVTITDPQSDNAVDTETELPAAEATSSEGSQESTVAQEPAEVPSDDVQNSQNSDVQEELISNSTETDQENEESEPTQSESQTDTSSRPEELHESEGPNNPDKSDKSNDPDEDSETEDTSDDSSTTAEAASATAEAASAKQPKAKEEPPYLSSGLSVDGTLRFFPAPQTSPTYNGKPRYIRGVIAIDGYVAGDGTIVLNNAPFLIANNTKNGR